MKTKCPNCGYQSDIDGLIRLMSGGEAFITAFDVPCELKQPLLKYLGLFRNPTGHDLTWDKLTKIINEMMPSIKTRKVTFNKQVFDAPPQAFVWGIEQMMKQFGEGKLKLPLKNHHSAILKKLSNQQVLKLTISFLDVTLQQSLF